MRRHNVVKVTAKDETTFVVDNVVIAISLSVLKAKSIEFEPRLPECKEAAINDLGVGIENKIALHFDKVFCPNVEFLRVVTETTYDYSYFLNLHKVTSHSILLYMPAR